MVKNLPAVDLGIMSEHLATHEGVINKLKMYHSSVNSPVVKNLLHLHIKILRNHVASMLALIDPDFNKEVHLPEMEQHPLDIGPVNFSEIEKDIILEARTTAKLMGSDNFNSALMMKNQNVKHVHIQMSYQDVTLQMLYGHLLKETTKDFVPRVTQEMQRLTLQKFYHVLKE